MRKIGRAKRASDFSKASVVLSFSFLIVDF